MLHAVLRFNFIFVSIYLFFSCLKQTVALNSLMFHWEISGSDGCEYEYGIYLFMYLFIYISVVHSRRKKNRRFRGAYCSCHQDETLVCFCKTTWRSISEGYHLHFYVIFWIILEEKIIVTDCNYLFIEVRICLKLFLRRLNTFLITMVFSSIRTTEVFSALSLTRLSSFSIFQSRRI
jgi:hypothetical protein